MTKTQELYSTRKPIAFNKHRTVQGWKYRGELIETSRMDGYMYLEIYGKHLSIKDKAEVHAKMPILEEFVKRNLPGVKYTKHYQDFWIVILIPVPNRESKRDMR